MRTNKAAWWVAAVAGSVLTPAGVVGAADDTAHGHGAAATQQPAGAPKAKASGNDRTDAPPATQPKRRSLRTAQRGDTAAKHEAKPATQPATKPAMPPDESRTTPAAVSTAHGSVNTHGDERSTGHADVHQVANGPSTQPGQVSAQEALALLKEGNERWAMERSANPSVDGERRAAVAAHGQTPFATVLTCSDSRVPVERIFDRGVGEIFTVRVAGNVAGASEAGTIEYGDRHLQTRLLVVMGHSSCGAVAAACEGTALHGNIAGLVERIIPAVERAKRNNPGMSGKDLVPLATRENVWQSVYDLLAGSSEVREDVQAGTLTVVGAIYDVGSGRVEFLGEHPWQRELLSALGGNLAPAATLTRSPAHTTPTDVTKVTEGNTGEAHGQATHATAHEAEPDAGHE